MKPDTPVAIGSAFAAVLSFADTGFAVTLALIVAAGSVAAACTAWAVWHGRKFPTNHHFSTQR